VPAKQRLLVKVKVKNGDLEFEPCMKEDQEKLEKARQEIEKLCAQKDINIPTENVAPFGVTIRSVAYGFSNWHNYFNPRQLLMFAKLIQEIREVEKMSPEETGKEATLTYLAISLSKAVNYNTIVTRWHVVLTMVADTLAERRPGIQWNWCDVNPFANVTGSWVRCLENTINGLKYIVGDFECYSEKENCRVLMDDATILGKIDDKFDLIITDPPYYDDVQYSELSDLYYVWLKRALSKVENDRLKPRFLPEAFFEKVGDDWVEVPTQWEKYALSEVSLNPPRLGSNATYEDGVKHFQNLLNSSFVTITSKLKDNGLLVTYYAHTDPNAWKALLEAGWAAAGLRVTNAFPLTTESAQSIVKRGKLSMDTSIVVVWRKSSEGSIEASELYNEMVEESANRARELMGLGATGRDLVIGTLAAALATATKYREVRVMGKIDTKTLVEKYIYPATYLGLARALARKAELKDGVKSPDAMFYLLVKSTLAGAKKKTLESTDLRLFSIGTSLDVNMAIKSWRILKAGEKEAGAKVAKAKTLTLVEPTSGERSKLAELLEARGVSLSNPNVRCVVDALHLVEYFAATYPREEFRRKLDELRANYPAQVEEALSLARIMAKVLPENDVEKGLCDRIVEHLSPAPGKLTSFFEEVK